jgi:hypothetical protein
VPNFTYGTFSGASDLNVGYVPPFEPYWCGKWNGLKAMAVDLDAANGSDVLPDGPSDAVLHMTRGTSDIWANFQWPITAVDRSAHTLKLGSGGWQFPRGTTNGHWFLDNAGVAALSSAAEWYLDTKQRRLFMVGNGTTAPPSQMIAAQRTTVIKQAGTQADPVTNVTLHDLTVAHADVTYLMPYE